MKEYRWVVFSIRGRELCRYSIKGTFTGEMEATVELLAYENGIEADEIEIKLEA